MFKRLSITIPETSISTNIKHSAVINYKPYPNCKIIVLNDDFNTFDHVANCLIRYIPAMTKSHAWELTQKIHFNGFATVWMGPLEQAELYHQQLRREGLTMAPLEGI